MPSPFLYFAHERLSPAELSAARLDGHLVELGEGYLPADAVETTAMRAASLARLLDGRLAVALVSAAWVWGAIPDPPVRHSLCRAVDHRVTSLVSRRATLHDIALAPDDLTWIGEVPVTTPSRTLADLARRSDAESLAAGEALVRSGAARVDDALAVLARRSRVPSARAARTFLAGLRDTGPSFDGVQAALAAGQAEVTR